MNDEEEMIKIHLFFILVLNDKSLISQYNSS